MQKIPDVCALALTFINLRIYWLIIRCGDFVMPLGFNEVASIEKLNETQANVFMFQNNWLILIPVSKKAISDP